MTNTIDQSVIDTIKRDIDLIALVESKGIQLKKNGRGSVGLCPFHNDKTPSLSVNPAENLWQCFSCGAGGDVIRFVEMFDNVNFPEAVSRLTTGNSLPKTVKIKPKASNKKPKMTAIKQKLLNRVIEFYHSTFTEDDRARMYLENRRIKALYVYKDYNIGFANGSFLNILPYDDDTINALKELGILNKKGKEHFYGCVTFPLYDMEGNPIGIYGRKAIESASKINHLYLPGLREGLFNPQTLKANKELILTESVIDSVTLINAGIKNTIPCYGTNGLTDHHINAFKSNDTKTVYVCFDCDESGIKGAKSVTNRLKYEGIESHTVTLPEGQDINDFFLLTADPVSEFKARLRTPPLAKKQAVKEKETNYTVTENGFTFIKECRHYEVQGITKGKTGTKLKATVKGIRNDNNNRKFHVDTVDLYSARSRSYFIKGLCDLFKEKESVVAGDLDLLTDHAEHYQPETTKEPVTTEISAKEKETALAFLKNPDMFSEILSDFEITGYTGEEMNKLLCYIAAVSRKMETPLSVMIQSRSAAGKSSLQDAVLSFIPKEDCIKYTRLTDQSLFYMESDSLVNKILAIEELEGMNGAIYSIRSIQSSKSVTIAYTGKDPVTGELRTQTNTVNGPLVVFITTTQVEIDGETASRFMFVSIDESEAMTRKILEKQRESRTMEGMLNKLKTDAITKKHKNANRLLKPVFVLNPYANLLTYTSKSIRARRDHTKYLNLIEAISFLFQYQRKIKTMKFEGETIEYINVTLSDIEKANQIAGDVLGRTLDELTPPSRNLLKMIREMVNAKSKEENRSIESLNFTRRNIREFSGWSDFQVRTHIKQLEDLEYIYPAMGKRGKEYVYELLATGEISDDAPFLIGLVDIKQLKKKAESEGILDDYEG